jgi:hypothetical protein
MLNMLLLQAEEQAEAQTALLITEAAEAVLEVTDHLFRVKILAEIARLKRDFL